MISRMIRLYPAKAVCLGHRAAESPFAGRRAGAAGFAFVFFVSHSVSVFLQPERRVKKCRWTEDRPCDRAPQSLSDTARFIRPPPPCEMRKMLCPRWL